MNRTNILAALVAAVNSIPLVSIGDTAPERINPTMGKTTYKDINSGGNRVSQKGKRKRAKWA